MLYTIIIITVQINNKNINFNVSSSSSLFLFFFFFSSFCFFFSSSLTRLTTSSKLTPLIILLALTFFLLFDLSRLPGVCLSLGFNGIGAGVVPRLLLERDFGEDTVELSTLLFFDTFRESSFWISSMTILSGYLLHFNWIY